MNIEKIEKIQHAALLKNRKDVIKISLYIKLIAIGIIPYDKDMDIIINLYERGGYTNQSQQNNFFTFCLENNYKRSIQSIRNTLAKYTDLGVLLKPKNNQRFVSKEWIPSIDSDYTIFLDCKISHN